jgi:hypothetical protein
MIRQLLRGSRNTVITVSIPDDQHHVAADVLCEQLARALRGTVLTGGQWEIVVEGSGRVLVDDQLVYEPPVRRTA